MATSEIVTALAGTMIAPIATGPTAFGADVVATAGVITCPPVPKAEDLNTKNTRPLTARMTRTHQRSKNVIHP